MKLTDAQVVAGMKRLGLSSADFQHLHQAPSLEEANRRLDELKTRAKKGFRKAAMDLHPDRHGGDESKTEEFKQLSAIVDEVDKLKMFAAPPRPPVRVVPITVRVHVGTGGWTTYSAGASTTATTTGSVYGGWGGWPY